MAKDYGISICKDALQKLSSSGDLKQRVSSALSELTVLRRESGSGSDLSQQNYDKIQQLDSQFDSKNNDEKTLNKLASDIVDICVKIIEENSK